MTPEETHKRSLAVKLAYDLGRSEALEEAAGVADSVEPPGDPHRDVRYREGYSDGVDAAAAAIRALAQK